MVVTAVSRTQVVRRRLPVEFGDQEALVRDVLAERGGILVYQKLDNRRELLEAFNIRKQDFDRLHAAITRLVNQNEILREEITTRRKESYCGFVNPASRQVTLTLVYSEPEPRKGLKRFVNSSWRSSRSSSG